MEKIRIDRWLWSVRIFKSRSQANAACKSNKIKITEKVIKPSYLVQVGETVMVRKNGFDLVFKIEKLLNKRVSAVLAAPCYTNLTTEDELNKYKHWYVGKAAAEVRDKGEGRPTKRNRRELEEFKDIQSLMELDMEDDFN